MRGPRDAPGSTPATATASAKSGLYPARHGVLITWPINRFVAELLDGRDRAGARAEFGRLARQVITAEIGRP